MQALGLGMDLILLPFDSFFILKNSFEEAKLEVNFKREVTRARQII